MLYWCFAHQFYHFRLPSKSEYSGLSNAEKCELYRSKESEQKKKIDALRKKSWRTKLKENPRKYEQDKVNERYRKLQNKENKAAEVEKAGQCSSRPDSSFSNRQPLHRSLSRADNHLPKSSHKKADVIEKLVEKYLVKIPFNTKRGRTRKDLNEEEKNGLKHSFFAVKPATPTLEGKGMCWQNCWRT